MDLRPRILIVADNISMKMGGESSFPFVYAKLLMARGAEVWMVGHARVRDELRTSLPEAWDRIRFVEDTPLMLLIFRIGRRMPYRVRELIFYQFIHMLMQRRAREIASALIREQGIEVVFEPTPIAPKAVSYMYGLGVPVAMGPLCGGMSFPPAFRHLDSWSTRLAISMGRRLSALANRLIPGRLRADVLMVANDQTAAALPRGCRGRVIKLIESGVDLSTWSAEATPQPAKEPGAPVRFVFVGRFVDWKGVQYLIPAFRKVLERGGDCVLDLIGDGELAPLIKGLVASHPLNERVRLHGWLSHPEAACIVRECDVFVMPSLRECGGGAILEAMALGKPIVATNWGGPANYVNETCGLLVDPSSEEAFVDGLADAMSHLAGSEELRARLGQGGKERVHQEYLDWDSKGDRVLEILKGLVREKVTT
jgi:glycosyltransferase involved in cell wall biosynthesis